MQNTLVFYNNMHLYSLSGDSRNTNLHFFSLLHFSENVCKIKPFPTFMGQILTLVSTGAVAQMNTESPVCTILNWVAQHEGCVRRPRGMTDGLKCQCCTNVGVSTPPPPKKKKVWKKAALCSATKLAQSAHWQGCLPAALNGQASYYASYTAQLWNGFQVERQPQSEE